MPIETNRKRSVRRIYAPGTKKDDKDKTYIPLKITDEITFQDEKAPHQEWVLAFANNPDATRSITVKYVGKDEKGKDLPKDQQLRVERLDALETEEDRGPRQSALWTFLGNKKDPPLHLETYKKKIYLSDEKGTVTDRNIWIEVQRIKKIEFADDRDNPRGQEYVWTLKHPDEDDENDDYTDVRDAVTKFDFTDINPPYRLDPFQTIVDCSFGRCMLVMHSGNAVAAIPMPSKRIDSLKGKKVAYQRKLQTSNWDRKCYPQCQIKVNKNFSVIMTPFKWSSGKVESAAKHQLSCSDNLAEPIETHLKNIFVPTFASDGATGHAPLDTFKITTVRDRKGQRHKIELTGQPDEQKFLPIWVNQKGVHYYMPMVNIEWAVSYCGIWLPFFYQETSHLTDENFDFQLLDEVEWRGDNLPSYQFYQTTDNMSVYMWPTNARKTCVKAISDAGNNLDAFCVGYAKNEEWVGSLYYDAGAHLFADNPTGDSYKMPFPGVSCSNGVDSFKPFDVKFGYEILRQYTYYSCDLFNKYWLYGGPLYYYGVMLPAETYAYTKVILDGDEAGQFDAYTYAVEHTRIYQWMEIDEIQTGIVLKGGTGRWKQLKVMPFPYAIADKYYKLSSGWKTNETTEIDQDTSTTSAWAGDEKWTLTTPTGSSILLDSGYVIPWCQASDGYNIVQGIGLAGGQYTHTESVKSYVFLNGKDITEELENLIGVKAKEFQAIFLDIKMSDITNLK